MVDRLADRPDHRPGEQRRVDPGLDVRHRYDQRQLHVRRQPDYDQRQYGGPQHAIVDGFGQAGRQHPDPHRQQHHLHGPDDRLSGVLQPLLAVSLPNYNTPGSVTVAPSAGITLPMGDGATNGWNAAEVGSLVTDAAWGNGPFNTATLGITATNTSLNYGGAISGALGLSITGGNNLLSGNLSFAGSLTVSNGTADPQRQQQLRQLPQRWWKPHGRKPDHDQFRPAQFLDRASIFPRFLASRLTRTSRRSSLPAARCSTPAIARSPPGTR